MVKQEDGNVAISSLDLLAETVQPSLMDTAAAVSAGGRAPERVRDLVSRVGHTQFDLVIMNPPFVRSTGMEAEKRGTGNPAFAAFDTDKATQRRMQDSLAVLPRNGINRYRQRWPRRRLCRPRAAQGS